LYLETIAAGGDKNNFMELIICRKQVKEKKTKQKLEMKKKRWIRDNIYGGNKEKTDQVCATLEKEGQKMKDRFFPNDDDEAWYVIEVERSFSNVNTCSESTEGRVKASLTKEEASDLFAKGGPLGPDQAPKFAGLTEEANVNMIAALEKEATGATITRSEAAKKRRAQVDEEEKKKKEEEAKKKEEARLAEIAANPKLAAAARIAEFKKQVEEKLEQVLGQKTRAMTYIMKLQTHELSDKLIGHLEVHQKLMDGVFNLGFLFQCPSFPSHQAQMEAVDGIQQSPLHKQTR